MKKFLTTTLLTFLMSVPLSVLAQEIPVLVITTPSYSKVTGCWATVYDGHYFRGRSMTVMGNTELMNLRLADGSNWEGQIDSVIVGPKASLTLYGSENLVDLDHTLTANSEIADLSQVPVGDDLESLRLRCN